MNNRFYILLFVLVSALAGCKRNEFPEPVQEEPKIWVQFTVNDSTYKFTSGVNSTTVQTHSKILNSKRDFIFQIIAPELKKELKVIVFNVPQNIINQSFDNVETELDRTIIPGVYRYGYNDGSVIWHPKQGDLAIEYTDGEYGEKYETLPAHQIQSSEFEIVSVKDAEFEGEEYKLAEIKFSCLIKCHATGGYYKITDGEGVVVFGE